MSPGALARQAAARLEDAKLEKSALLAIVGLAVIVRLLIAALLPAQAFDLEDNHTYLAAARALLDGRVIPSEHVMPGYPLLLALVGGSPVAGLCANLLLSAIGIWCLARLTQAITDSRLAGLLAALIWSLYPFAVFYAVAGLSETLFVTLILLGFLCYYRCAFTLGSLVMVAAILTRPLVELLTPILILTFAMIVHRETAWRALRHVGVFLAIYVTLMVPWWTHNFVKYGSFVRLNLAFGLVLHIGNNPMNDRGGVVRGVDYDLSPIRTIDHPVAQERALRDTAIKFIQENPGRFIELAGWKFLRLWGPSSGHRFVAVSLLSFIPIALLAIVGFFRLWRDRWRRLLPIGIFLGYTTAVHMITIGILRYRFPMEPFLAVLAAYGIAPASRSENAQNIRKDDCGRHVV